MKDLVKEKKVRYSLHIVMVAVLFIIGMLGFQYVGIKPLQFTIPIPSEIDVFDGVIPYLNEKKHSFSLKISSTDSSFLQESGGFESASAYGVIDFDSGEVILAKNISTPLPIASLTKIMTAVVALDLVSSDTLFTVSKRASLVEPTKIGVLPNQKYSVRELIEAMILTSANDAAQVIQENIDTLYKGDVFIRAMNEKAAFLGMSHTHFTNPQGFDRGNPYSSVEDVLLLSQYAVKNYPLIKQVAKNDYLFLPSNSTHPQVDLYNWNGLLGVYPGVSGLKIGNTDAAQKTTSVIATRDGNTLLVVLLGAPGVLERDLWTSQLLDIGFSMKTQSKPIKVTEEQLRTKYATWKYWN